jgi:hypothetical protein
MELPQESEDILRSSSLACGRKDRGVSGSDVMGVAGLIVAETVNGEYAYDDGTSE